MNIPEVTANFILPRPSILFIILSFSAGDDFRIKPLSSLKNSKAGFRVYVARPVIVAAFFLPRLLSFLPLFFLDIAGVFKNYLFLLIKPSLDKKISSFLVWSSGS